MAQIPWTASAIHHVHDQPPTFAGLLSAVAAADRAADFLDGGAPGSASAQAGSVGAECKIARAHLEAASGRHPASAPVFDAPAEPGDPSLLRDLDQVLVACIDLALDVLDNEDEPLDVCQVTAVSQAVDHLDAARWHCWEAAQCWEEDQ